MTNNFLLSKQKILRQIAVMLVTLWLSQPLIADNNRSIMVLGDSISAAFGIQREQSWVNLLDQHLQQHYSAYLSS